MPTRKIQNTAQRALLPNERAGLRASLPLPTLTRLGTLALSRQFSTPPARRCVRRVRWVRSPERAASVLRIWDSEGGRRGSFLRQPRVPAVGAMSSAGARSSSPLRAPLKAGDGSIQAKKQAGCEILLFGCERVGWAAFPHPAWDSEGGRRGHVFREPKGARGRRDERGRGCEVRAPFAPPSTAQHVCSSQKLSVSSAGGAKVRAPSRPL